MAELLAERGVRVDPSTIHAWVGEFAPLYEEAARPFRHTVGGAWSVDETHTKVAGKPAYVYRAIDGQGQVVDVSVSARRATDDAATFFRRASVATGTVPDGVATGGAATPARAGRDAPGRPARDGEARPAAHRARSSAPAGAAAPEARLQDARRGAHTLPGARLPAQPVRRLLRSPLAARFRSRSAGTTGGAFLGRAHDRAAGALDPVGKPLVLAAPGSSSPRPPRHSPIAPPGALPHRRHQLLVDPLLLRCKLPLGHRPLHQRVVPSPHYCALGLRCKLAAPTE